MGMTMTQKILASHAGLDEVRSGDLIEAKLDLVLGNDVTTPPAIDVFRKMGAKDVFDKAKVCLVPDHFTPNKDIKSAELTKCMRCFAREQAIENYFELGQKEMERSAEEARKELEKAMDEQKKGNGEAGQRRFEETALAGSISLSPAAPGSGLLSGV